MPRSIGTFTTEWLNLIERASQRPITVDCGTPEKARSLRATWHALKAILKRDGREELPVADSVATTIDPARPHLLTFSPRDQSWAAKAIAQALLQAELEDQVEMENEEDDIPSDDVKAQPVKSLSEILNQFGMKVEMP